MFRGPSTLWRFASAELWRLVLLTASVLVCVIAFALVLQLFSAGKVGPQDIPKLMVLAVVPMLQYALPFAAGFGATLAYHRMAQDNEVIAASAGGVPHRTLLVPAVIAGLLLAGGLTALNEQVIPRFLRSIERMVTQDAVKLMVKNIDRGEAIQADNVMLTADRIFQLDADEASGVQDRLIMEGVVALELDREGRVLAEATAERARVWFFGEGPGNDQGLLAIHLENGVYDKSGESAARFDLIELNLAVPNAFQDDPKFLTFSELRELREYPDRMSFVEMRRRDLAYHLGARIAAEGFGDAIASGQPMQLIDEEGQRVRVWAGGLEERQNRVYALLPGQAESPVRVEYERLDVAGEPDGVTVYQANEALLRIDLGPDRGARRLVVGLELSDYRVEGVRGGGGADASGALATRVLPGMKPVPDPMIELIATDSAGLLARAEPRIAGPRGDNFLRGPTVELRKRIDKLGREITSKQHERWAMAASCFVMVLTGAVTALRLGNSMPLTVYLWSFFPALGALITISGGQKSVHDFGAPGLLMLWGGVLALSVYTFVAYRGLKRH